MSTEHLHACCHHSQGSCIRLVPIFNHLEDEQLNEIMGKVKSISIKKGEILYRQGEPSTSLYVVNKGKVKIYRLSDTGKEQLLRILKQGEFTGELAIFNESTHETFAEAMTDSEICTISKEDMQQFLIKYPTISLKILAELSNRLEASEKQATRVATEKVETRIALFLAECAEEMDSLEFILPMTKKDMASYLGTTPETISRKIAEFEELRLIKQITHKKIKILDLDGLLLI